MSSIKTTSERPKYESDYGLTEEEQSSLLKAIENENSNELCALIDKPHNADIADFIDSISNDERRKFIELAKDNFNPEILVELSDDVKEEVLELLGSKASAKIINNLNTGDAVDVIEDLTANEQIQIIQCLTADNKIRVQDSLSYPEDSAGRLVNKKIISIPEFWTVGQTIDFLRSGKNQSYDFYHVFLTDPRMKPSGAVLLSRIITAKRETKLLDLQASHFKTIPANLDQEEVAYIFRQYGMPSAPVVNEEGRMIGVINIDDIIDVIEEEAQEDIMHLGGISETDLYTDSMSATKRRLPWLMANLATALIASFVIAMFEGVIAKLASLAVLMPIVASMGGNAGTQSVTMMVRSIATKELNSRNSVKIIKKELYVGVINGLIFSIISFLLSYSWYQDFNLSIIFSAATLLTLCFAGVCGAIVPLVLLKFKIDPAVASSVLLTTITDIMAFGLFLGFANWLI